MTIDTPARAPLRVLFLCTRNSARSQFAEALLERKGRDRFQVESAGAEPAAQVHPLTVETLRRVGTEWDDRRPKGLESVSEQGWDLVITVCEKAHESCPRLPGRPVTAHWSVPDPEEAEGERPVREAAFWDAFTILTRRIDLLCALPDRKLRGLALKAAMREMGESEPPAAEA